MTAMEKSVSTRSPSNSAILLAVGAVLIVLAGREIAESRERNGAASGGSGPGASRNRWQKNDVVVRIPARTGQGAESVSSEFPFEDPAAIRAILESDDRTKMMDSYEVAFPTGLIFDPSGKLTLTGQSEFRRLAQVVQKTAGGALRFDLS